MTDRREASSDGTAAPEPPAPELPSQLSLGRMYRDEGVARVRRYADSEYRVKVEQAILECARESLKPDGEAFTVDHVRAKVGDPPEGQSSNILGALFIAAANRKPPWIERVHDDLSRRKERHAGRIGVWIGVEGTPALREAEATA